MTSSRSCAGALFACRRLPALEYAKTEFFIGSDNGTDGDLFHFVLFHELLAFTVELGNERLIVNTVVLNAFLVRHIKHRLEEGGIDQLLNGVDIADALHIEPVLVAAVPLIDYGTVLHVDIGHINRV